MGIEITANHRLEAVRVMLGLEKKKMCSILDTSWYAYNEVAMGRRGVPIDWLTTLERIYGINPNWIVNETGRILC